MDAGGYTFLCPARRLLAYDLDAPQLERLRGPALPFARAMLGARALHEWAHLAAAAGWVPRVAPDGEVARLLAELSGALDETVRSAPLEVRRRTAEDLRRLAAADAAARSRSLGDDRRPLAGSTPGTALVRALLARIPDYQANLLASRFWTAEEAEVYVRHNVRPLRAEYSPAQAWRMLVRYLYERQYLAFSAVADARRYFLSSTWFAADFIETGMVGDSELDRLMTLVAALCAAYAVDESRFRFAPAHGEPDPP
jgi:hypothetical protein